VLLPLTALRVPRGLVRRTISMRSRRRGWWGEAWKRFHMPSFGQKINQGGFRFSLVGSAPFESLAADNGSRSPTPTIISGSGRRSSFSSGCRCVTRENVVPILCRRVAGEARCVQRLIARFALREVRESPAAGRGIFF
jgi:hypothetical protein